MCSCVQISKVDAADSQLKTVRLNSTATSITDNDRAWRVSTSIASFAADKLKKLLIKLLLRQITLPPNIPASYNQKKPTTSLDATIQNYQSFFAIWTKHTVDILDALMSTWVFTLKSQQIYFIHMTETFSGRYANTEVTKTPPRRMEL